MSHNHSGDCEQTCPHGHDHSPHAQPHISSVWQVSSKKQLDTFNNI